MPRPKRMPRKQPGERLDYKLDFTGLLAEGDSIPTPDDVEVLDSDPEGLTLDDPTFDLDNNLVYVWAEGGTHGVDYKITCRATTALELVREIDIVIPVREL